MRRMAAPDRRRGLVDAALAVMRRKGIGATTVRDVAAEIGSSSGLVHHYFASMDDLLAAAFQRAAGADLEATVQAVAQGRDPVDRMRRFFGSYSRGEQDDAMQLWLDAWSEAARRPALQRISRRLNEQWQALLADLIRDGVKDGLMTCADPDAEAWRLLSLLDGLALQTVAHRLTITVDDVARWSRGQAESDLSLPPGVLAPR